MARRVFFSFHYDDVASFRANVVRNSGAFKIGTAQFHDASIWEEAQKKGIVALKTLIESELKGTSVTALLIGEETAARQWVRYEIMKSFARGNGLLGIYIHLIPDKHKRLGRRGVNPFEELGFRLSSDGKVLLFEKKEGRWVPYDAMRSFKPKKNRRHKPSWIRDMFNRPTPLSSFVKTYTWQAGQSHADCGVWIEESLRRAEGKR